MEILPFCDQPVGLFSSSTYYRRMCSVALPRGQGGCCMSLLLKQSWLLLLGKNTLQKGYIYRYHKTDCSMHGVKSVCFV
jgi:hypothetical protein